MNHYQVIRKLCSTIEDKNLKKEAENIRSSSAKSILIEVNELESILNHKKKIESIELEDISVERT